MKKLLVVLLCGLQVSCFAMNKDEQKRLQLKELNVLLLNQQADAQLKIAYGVELLATTKAAKTCLQLESSEKFKHLIPEHHCDHIINAFLTLTEKNNS